MLMSNIGTGKCASILPPVLSILSRVKVDKVFSHSYRTDERKTYATLFGCTDTDGHGLRDTTVRSHDRKESISPSSGRTWKISTLELCGIHGPRRLGRSISHKTIESPPRHTRCQSEWRYQMQTFLFRCRRQSLVKADECQATG